jgi:predicted dinucleotide-binding enzyme
MAPPVVALGLFGTGLIGTAHMEQLAKQVRRTAVIIWQRGRSSLPVATAAATAAAAAASNWTVWTLLTDSNYL